MKKITILILCMITAIYLWWALFTRNANQNNDNNVRNSDKIESAADDMDKEVFFSDDKRLKKYELLGSLPEEKVSVYGRPASTGNYDKIAVQYKDIIKFFDWVSIKKEPSIEMKDLNGDGGNEIAIILRGTYGTGIYKCYPHVLETEKLKELKIVDVRKILQDKIITELQSDKIVFNLNGRKQSLNHNPAGRNVKELYDNLYIGSTIFYRFDNNMITCRASVQSIPSDWYGDILIKYAFKDGEFVMDSVEYEPDLESKDLHSSTDVISNTSMLSTAQ